MKERNSINLLAGGVAIITFLVYLPALRNQFVWDDILYIVENPHVSSFDTGFLKWAFFDFYAGNWHPVAWMSHAFDYALWGLNPLGHHLTNVILHAINAFLVVLLTAKLLEAEKERTGRSPSPEFPDERSVLIIAGMTGLLFGIHPLHVESAAWVAERKDLLCAMFYLLALAAYANYAVRARPGTGDREPGGRNQGAAAGMQAPERTFRNKHFAAALGFFILAGLSKPMAVSLPVVLLILDWYPLQRIYSFRMLLRAFVEKLPFIGWSLLVCMLAVLSQKSGDALSTAGEIPLQVRVLVAAKSLVAYMVKMAAPYDLTAYYPYPEHTHVSLLSADYLWPVVTVIGITLAAMVAAKKQQLWLAVWGCYVVTLLPVLGIVQVGGQAMADRYTYLPSLGPFLVAGLGAAWIGRTAGKHRKPTLALGLALGAIAVALSLLAYLTVHRIGVWEDDLSLWSAVIDEQPGRVAIAYNNRGTLFDKMGQIDKAIADYDAAIALHPDYYQALNNRALAFNKKGLFDRALADYDKAITSNASYAEAFANRASVFVKIGKFGSASEDFDKAIALDPQYYKTYNNRALFYVQTGQVERAIEDFNRALTFSPPAAQAVIYFNLGIVYRNTGRFEKAIESFNAALAIDPDSSAGYLNRGITYSIIGQPEKALSDYTAAIRADDTNAGAYLGRGAVRLKTGQRELALSDYQRACSLGDDNGCKAAARLGAGLHAE